MTPRERNLLVILIIVAGSALILIGLGLYLDGLSRLDSEFVALQKRALRITQASLIAQGSGSGSSIGGLRERFFAPGALPEPLVLAARVQASLKSSGLRTVESRVTESSAKAQWLQYRAEGDIESWFRFLKILRSQDSQTLFRSLSLLKKQDYGYAIAFEVGHAVLP